jgi:hypothetical protein
MTKSLNVLIGSGSRKLAAELDIGQRARQISLAEMMDYQ